jgi:hypothetical protein
MVGLEVIKDRDFMDYPEVRSIGRDVDGWQSVVAPFSHSSSPFGGSF